MSLPSASTNDDHSVISTNSPTQIIPTTNDALDLNSTNFDAEYYVQNLLHKKGLEELVAVEQDMVNNVRRLDSEMQSLVYENYSKFLNATSTVKDMQNRLIDTHTEMRDLSTRMKRITELSDSLTEKFAKNCEKVRKLNEAKDSVKKLEFLIKAPQIMENCIEQGQIVKAVEIYVVLRPKLEKFRYIKSMSGIIEDAEKIISGIKTKFEETLDNRLISSEDVMEAVSLLKRLGISEKQLENRLLKSWEREIQAQLDQLDFNANPEKGRLLDIFDFVDTGCCHFLTNLSLMASTFLQLFPKQTSKAEFIQLLERTMQRFGQIVDGRFLSEQNAGECALFVKALDRIYRKISVLTRLAPDFNFMRLNSNIVQNSAKYQIARCRQSIIDLTQKKISEFFSEFNHSLPALSSSKSDNGRSPYPLTIRHPDRKELLKETIEKFEQFFVHSVKTSLASLLMFTASDIIFTSIPYFCPMFGFDVHQQIVVGAIRDMIDELNERINARKRYGDDGMIEECQNRDYDAHATEALILCTFARNFQLKHLDHLMELCREQYRLAESRLSEKYKLTSRDELVGDLMDITERLLRKFVEIKSGTFIEMTKRSIDSFDWAACVEVPARIRSLVKHFVHSVEEMNRDLAVFLLMDDGGLAKLKERTPDSLHGYSMMRRATSAASSAYNDASSVSSGGIVERLWGEMDTAEESGISGTVETAATVPIEFRRDVITNSIIRLVLQAMCDFVRIRKFSQHGLQQLQVDCAYMRQKLWACVSDEHMLNMSIEDVVTAAVNQCSQPKLLDPSVVRSICECEEH